MEMQSLQLTLHGAQAVKSELDFLAQACDRLPEVLDRAVHLSQSGVEVLRVDGNGATAPRTGECGLRLELSQQFAELVAAVRAGEFDGR